MKKMHKLISLLMAALICTSLIPASMAASVPQPAMWFMDTVKISQIPNGNYSHKGTQNFDVIGHNGNSNIKAPFDCKVVAIYRSWAEGNTVVVESLDKVLYADGTVDYMTMTFAHDEDISNLFNGKILKQGEIFYQTGEYGDADGVHSHVCCIRGRFQKDIWTRNQYNCCCSPNAIAPTSALFLPAGISVIQTKGLTFKTYNPVTHTLSFHANGGKVKTASLSVPGGSCSSLPIPTRSGYGFAGWYTKASGGTQVTSSTPINSSMTLYAHWCKHDFSGGICSKCKYEYPITIQNMSPTAYKTSAACPVWSRPYSHNSAKLTTLPKGTYIVAAASAINEPGNPWVRLADGSGWCYLGNLVNASNVSVRKIKNTDGCLNIRTSGSTKGSIVGTVPEGCYVTTHSSKSTSGWYYINYTSAQVQFSGFGSKNYIK